MLNKNIPIPLYYQLKERLTLSIQNGELPVGSLVPPERELSDLYGISRMTVRQALGELVKEGLLVREQGKGTFVAEPKINQGLWKLTSFSEDIKSRGMEPDSRIEAIYVQDAPSLVAQELGLSSNLKVVVFERVRLADQKPMAYEISHLPLSKFPGLDQVELHTASLYQLIEERYKIAIHHARQTMEAGLATPNESLKLGIKPKSSVLLIQRVTYDSKNHPFEYVKSVYRGDRYQLQVELYR